MSKLRAYGRHELWRVEKVTTFGGTERKSYETIEDKKQYAAMSDGNLLHRLTCKWKDGQYHDYGWKKTTYTKQTSGDFQRLYNTLIGKGYVEVEKVK